MAMTIVLVIRVWRLRSGQVRRAAGWAGAAILSEAAIGAAIVLFEWVGSDDSLARLIAVPLHLVNTFVLLAALTMVVWYEFDGPPVSFRDGPMYVAVVGGFVGLALTAATGAVTALADTLFPAVSVSAGIQADFSASASALTRLRILHPIVAVVVGVVIATAARRRAPQAAATRWVVGLVVVQFAIGVVNVLLLTPVWLQLVHLAAADGLWIAWVWLAAEVSSTEKVAQPVA